MYIYNPSEPAGVSRQPGPDIRDPIFFLVVNSQTRGRCGNCAAVPKCWQFEVPIFPDPYAADYAGTVRLHRRPYTETISEGSKYRGGNCTWEQRSYEEPSLLLNTYKEWPYDEGWFLTYEPADTSLPNDIPGGWNLYTPFTTAGTNPAIGHRSVYRYAGDQNFFSGLGPNLFILFGEAAERAFVYTPDRLVLTPVYA